MRRPARDEFPDKADDRLETTGIDNVQHKQSTYFGSEDSNLGAQTGTNFGTINNYATDLYRRRSNAEQFQEIPKNTWTKDDEDDFLSSLVEWSDENTGSTVQPPPANTCNWVLQRNEFKDWLNPEGQSLLFIAGMSGSGKSTLAKFLANRFREDGNTVIDFYCKTLEAADADPPLMLYLVYQLLVHENRKNFEHVFPRYHYRSLHAKRPSSGTLYEIFRAIVRARAKSPASSTVFVIIDGLDELHENYSKDFLVRLNTLFNSDKEKMSLLNLKLVVLARDNLLIKRGAEGHLRLLMTTEDTKADIEHYVRGEMTRIANSRGYPPGLQKRVESKICYWANGYFIWVKLVLADLDEPSKDISEATIFRTIDECNDDLGSRYANAFSRISLDPVLIERLFIIVLGSFQNHSIGALESALTVCAIDETSHLDLRGKILRSCLNLLKIDEDDKVTLIHTSLQRFLTQPEERLRQVPLQEKCSSRDRINSTIAKICLEYLLQPGIRSIWEKRDAMSHIEMKQKMDKEYPFFAYAMKHWKDHVRNRTEVDDETCALIQKLFEARTKPERTTQLKAGTTNSVRCYEMLIQMWTWINKGSKSASLPKQFFLHHFAVGNLASVFETSDAFLQNVIKTSDQDGRTFFSLLKQDYGTIHKRKKPIWRVTTGEVLDIHDERGLGLLHLAAMYGSNEMLSALLKCRSIAVDMRSSDGFSRTALHFAARGQNIDCVRTLLSKDADPNAVDHEGMTALHFVLSTPDPALRYDGASLLLDHGADVNLRDTDGKSPLTMALAQRNIDDDMLYLLGGSVGRLNLDHRLKLLVFTAMNNRIELMKRIIPSYEELLNTKDPVGYTALHYAIESGYLEMVQLLITHGSDVKIISDEDENLKATCLQLAIQFEHEPVVKLLLEVGTDPNIPSPSGTPMLAYAVHHDTTAVLDLLLAWDAEVSAVRRNTPNAIHFAAYEGRMEALHKLLKVSTLDQINASSAECDSPLFFACSKGHVEAVQALLEAGADVSLTCSDSDRKIMDVVPVRNRNDIARLLLHYGADPLGGELPRWSQFHSAAREGNTELFLRLLGTTPPRDVFEIKSELQKTPLWIGCLNGHLEFVKFMIGLGAEVHSCTAPDGRNLVHAASQSGNVELLRYLRDYSPTLQNLHSQTKSGGTPLSLACERGHLDAAKYLIEEGADPNDSFSNGETCLHAASASGNADLCQLLLSHNIDPNKVDEEGWNALHYASLAQNNKESSETVDALLRSGIDASVTTRYRKHNALFQFCLQTRQLGRSFQRLLEHPRASLQHIHVERGTILHFALSKHRPLNAAGIASFLYAIPGRSGAQSLLDELLQIRDAFGQRPYDIISSQHFNSEQTTWDIRTSHRASMMASVSKSIIRIIDDIEVAIDARRPYILCSLLIAIGDEDEAYFWLCHCTSLSNGVNIHNDLCNMCNKRINTDRYICRICEEVDLCEPCMWKYVKGTLSNSPCHNHSFFKVRIDDLVSTKPESDHSPASNDQNLTTDRAYSSSEKPSAKTSAVEDHGTDNRSTSDTKQSSSRKRWSDAEVKSRLENLREKYSLLSKVIAEHAERQEKGDVVGKPAHETSPSIFFGTNLPLMLQKPNRRICNADEIRVNVYGAIEHRCANGCPEEEQD